MTKIESFQVPKIIVFAVNKNNIVDNQTLNYKWEISKKPKKLTFETKLFI